MSSQVPAQRRRLPVVKLGLLAVGGVIAAILLLRGGHLGELANHGIEWIRGLGALVFFLAMTVLPAFGAPMLAFTMTAGQAFAPELGMSGVVAASALALAINLALGYWVSRYVLRPILAGWIERYGYGVPRVTRENALTVTLLVRLTPGPPYALQACLLGMAEVPFRLYMIVSWLGMLPWVLGGVILGKGLFSGKFGVAFGGICVLVAAVAAVHLVRRRLTRRRGPEADPTVQPAHRPATGSAQTKRSEA